MKAGVKTSEFWVSAVSSLIGLLVLSGKVTSEEADQLNKAITAAIGAVMTIASTLAYIVTRIQLKQSVVDAITETSTTPHPASAGDPLAQPQATVATAKTFTAADAFHMALDKAGV